jgi:hypothetical protein
MKKIMLLLTAILVITYLSSPPVQAASRSYESRTTVIMRIIYHHIFGLGASAQVGRDFIPILIDDSDDPILRGDADHLGGGKSDDRMGDEDKNDLSAGMDADALNNFKFSTD